MHSEAHYEQFPGETPEQRLVRLIAVVSKWEKDSGSVESAERIKWQKERIRLESQLRELKKGG
jgi:hypothetical protein